MTETAPDAELSPERTLVLIKPDAVLRGLSGRILSRFEDIGLKIVAVKTVRMDAELIRRHYADLEERLGTEIYLRTAAFMSQGPVISLVLEGFDVVATVRKLIGAACPNEAAPGTIRGDLSHFSSSASIATGKGMANLVHASANREEAAYEIGVWFAKEELLEYRTLAEQLMY
ncbi:nucleoside-diphosphate kinase [Streptomyces sulfonofaciens]|nr:nucleoside-diphosphate kinase [Streptomyces sulfonofaciens]